MNYSSNPAQPAQHELTLEYAGIGYLAQRFRHKTRSRTVFDSLLLRPVAPVTTLLKASSTGGSQVVDLQREKHGAIRPIGAPIEASAPEATAPFGTPKNPLVIGFDAEWQQINAGSAGRRVLSQQLSIRDAGGCEWVWVLLYPLNSIQSFRLSLSTVLAWFFEVLVAARVLQAYPVGRLHAVLVSHFDSVDLSTFWGAVRLIRKLDSVRRCLVSIQRPLVVPVWTYLRNYRCDVVLTVRDSVLLSAAGTPLERLGQALGLPKLNLPAGYTKADMQKLRANEFAAYICYAARDAEIARRWAEQTAGRPNAVVPPTLGSMAVRDLKSAICAANGWSSDDYDREMRGLVTQTQSRNGRPRRVLVPTPTAVSTLAAAAEAFYGGRNECFAVGAHAGPFFDLDLCGAYPTAMALLPDPDFSLPRVPIVGAISFGILRPDQYFFGLVEFEFPDSCRYPCLPVKDTAGRGLIYPLRGTTWASAPEVWLALQLGASIRVIDGGIQPAKPRYSLRAGIATLLQARKDAEAQYGKTSPQALIRKEIANSCYGKMAQGLAGKRAYSTRTDSINTLPPSTLTSAPVAAMITSLVRAIVSAAIVQLDERGYRILSVTTDGILTDAPIDVVANLDLFGLAAAYARARSELVADARVWELKHMAKDMLMIKTRGAAGLGTIEGQSHALPAAAAGLRLTPEQIQAAGGDRAAALAKVYVEREGRARYVVERLPAPKDYVRRASDGQPTLITRTANLEYDYKRRPDLRTLCDVTVNVGGKDYTVSSYLTLPWRDINEFDSARSVLADKRDTAIKTAKHVESVDALMQRRIALTGSNLHIKGGLQRNKYTSILRGIRSGALHADWLSGLSGREIAKRVADALGLELADHDNDWKHAGRRSRRSNYVLDGLESDLQALGLTRVDNAVSGQS